MTLAQQEPMRISLFDRYSLIIPPELKHHMDGPPGKRVVFITDAEEHVLISFEENMACMDLTGASRDSVSKRIESEHQSKDRYIHQLRTDPATRPGIGNYAFFHMEMPDETGELHILPGQMTAPCGYAWSDGVEPVLIDLMNGLTVCSPNGGGGDLLTNPRAFRN